MSLWWWRRAVERAALGDLGPSADRRVRRHVQRCAACRAHYDALATMAGGPTEAERQRQRLLASLPRDEGNERPVRARAWWLPAALVPVAVVVVLLVRPQEPELTERGARTPPNEPLAVSVYAARRNPSGGREPLRLVADLPASGEAALSRADFVQLGYRNTGDSLHLVLLARDAGRTGDARAVRWVVPADGVAGGQAAALAPSTRTRPLGPGWDLAALPAPSRLELYAVTSHLPFSLTTVRTEADLERLKTTRTADADVPVAVVRLGVWAVSP